MYEVATLLGSDTMIEGVDILMVVHISRRKNSDHCIGFRPIAPISTQLISFFCPSTTPCYKILVRGEIQSHGRNTAGKNTFPISYSNFFHSLFCSVYEGGISSVCVSVVSV